MNAPTVVVFTTYPIVQPRHGGQIRTRALVESYREAGFDVVHLAIFEKGTYPASAIGDKDIAFPTDDPRWFIDGRNVPLTNDIRSGRFAAESDEAYQKVLQALPNRVEAFHLEQPWLLPVVKKLRLDPRYRNAQVIYGSQNVEAPLRKAIFQQLSIAGGEPVLAAISQLEEECCRYADLTLAVAPADQQALVAWGARRMLMAPNGIAPWSAPEQAVDEWRAKLDLRRIALFVGSAHPPNVDGFVRALGDALGCVPPDCKIVCAGSVGAPVLGYYQRTRFSTLNVSRLYVTGEVSDVDLAALKTLATVFLLPIFEGGGSNIKTAEAIYSGRQVIATSNSLRGYDSFIDLPEITVANTVDGFRNALRTALSPSTPVPERLARADTLRARLTWQSCLAPVPPAVKELLAS